MKKLRRKIILRLNMATALFFLQNKHTYTRWIPINSLYLHDEYMKGSKKNIFCKLETDSFLWHILSAHKWKLPRPNPRSIYRILSADKSFLYKVNTFDMNIRIFERYTYAIIENWSQSKPNNWSIEPINLIFPIKEGLQLKRFERIIEIKTHQ